MKLLLLCLLCAGSALAQSISPAYDVALKKEQAAETAMNACLDQELGCAEQRCYEIAYLKAEHKWCAAEKAAYWEASDEVQAAIDAALAVDLDRVTAAAADLNAVTDHINAYVSCRRARRWWQFWKRCRY